LLGSLVLSISLLAPAPSSADTVTLGSKLQDPVTIYFGSYMGVQLSSTRGDRLASPSDGVITEWAVRTGLASELSLLILRPRGVGDFTLMTKVTVPAPAAATPDTIYRFPAPSVPISKGDSVGLEPKSTDVPHSDTGNPADVLGGNGLTEPTIGESVAPLTSNEGAELALQATVRFCNAPDVAGKKVSEAKALITAADCTPVIKKKKAKKKKRKRVIKQRTPAGTTGVPGTPVEILVGKKQGKKRKKGR
jgi:hypothetical protein